MVSSPARPTTATDEVWRLPAALYTLRPNAARKLDHVNQRAWEYVDPSWLELVRLRIAQLIGTPAGLSARSSAARRAGLSEDTIGEARTRFSPEELAQLCLDLTKWSTQKVLVALGADGADDLPINAAGTASFGFDAAGRITGFSPT